MLIRRSIAFVVLVAMLALQVTALACENAHHQEQPSRQSHESHSERPADREPAPGDCIMMSSCGMVIPASTVNQTFSATPLADHPVILSHLYTAPALGDPTPPPRNA